MDFHFSEIGTKRLCSSTVVTLVGSCKVKVVLSTTFFYLFFNLVSLGESCSLQWSLDSPDCGASAALMPQPLGVFITLPYFCTLTQEQAQMVLGASEAAMWEVQ